MIKRVDKRLQAVQCLTGNKIKIIACITMLIDHFSKIFLESIMNDPPENFDLGLYGLNDRISIFN